MSGQAMVEAAITLPLVLFLILGTLQLFMMLQGRIMAQYAVFRAARAGALTQGDCGRMTAAALGAVLPAFTLTNDVGAYTAAYQKFGGNSYAGLTGFRGGIVSVGKSALQPGLGDVRGRMNRQGPGGQDPDFDQPEADPMRLTATLVFWYPLRIPFANWVMSHAYLAHFGFRDRVGSSLGSPYSPARNNTGDFSWTARTSYAISSEFADRVSSGEYVFPIFASYSMRMMSPPRWDKFPPAPNDRCGL